MASPATTKEFHYTVAANAIVTLTNPSGVVRIAPGNPGNVNVTATLHSQQLQVDATQHGNSIELVTHAPANNAPGPEQVDYVLEVPSDGSLSVTDDDGRIDLSGFRGTATLQGDSVEISAEDIQGAQLRIRTLTGGVKLNNVRQAEIDVVSVSGPVEMKQVSGDHVNVNTASGRIAYTGDFAGGGSYSLETNDSEIVVNLPVGAAADVSARSLRGAVENEGTPLTGPAHLTGSPDLGTAKVVLRSVSGTIRVKKQ